MKFLVTVFSAVLLAPSIAAQPAADLVLINGRVFTSDPSNRWAEAVAITGNVISAAGTNDDVTKLIGTGTKRIDLRGRLVIPGINEAHREETPWPESFKLPTTPHSTAAEIDLALISASDESPAVMWLTGIVAHQTLTSPEVSAARLEKAAPGRKVVLCTETSDVCVLSASALNALRIRRDVADAAAGFERDANGTLSGRASGNAAALVRRRVADSVSDDDALAFLRDVASDALRQGITSIQNVSSFPILRFEKSVRHADVPLRIRMIRFPIGDENEGSKLPQRDRERELSIVSGTERVVGEVPAKESLATNDQLLFSVTDERAASELLEAIKAVSGVDWNRKRLRFENAESLTPALIPTVKTLGIVVVAKPGPSVALKTLQRAGIPLALRSDGQLNPFVTIMLATTGSDSISREDAVQAFTRGAAFAEFAENDKGTIAPGKVADLAVLSQDIFKVPADELPNTGSELTIVNGRIAYDAGTLDIPGRPKRRPVPLD